MIKNPKQAILKCLNQKIKSTINIKSYKISLILISNLISLFATLIIPINPIFADEDYKIFSNNDNKNHTPGTEYLNKKTNQDYIIDSGDSLIITPSRLVPDLINIVQVDGNGTIFLPRLNRIYISGLTVNELITILNKKYSEYLKNPDVEVIIDKYRPVRIYLDGELQSPGMYILPGSYNSKSVKSPINFNNKKSTQVERDYFFPTLFEALQIGGGVTYFSDLSAIEITRKNTISNGGGLIKAEVNFLKLIESGDLTQNIRIYDSDVIKIRKSPNNITAQLSKAMRSNLNPDTIKVYISGRINGEKGYVELSKSASLSDAIDMSGGAKTLRGPVKFTRFNSDGSKDIRKFNYNNNYKRGSYKNPILMNGDFIYVGKNAFNVGTEIIGELTSPFRGIYSVIRVLDTFDD